MKTVCDNEMPTWNKTLEPLSKENSLVRMFWIAYLTQIIYKDNDAKPSVTERFPSGHILGILSKVFSYNNNNNNLFKSDNIEFHSDVSKTWSRFILYN